MSRKFLVTIIESAFAIALPAVLVFGQSNHSGAGGEARSHVGGESAARETLRRNARSWISTA